MNDIDLAWLAGIVDGEGCIGLFRRANSSSNGKKIISVTASATITNSNCLILDRCREILICKGIKFSYICPRNSTKRKLMRIQIRNYESLGKLASEIKPFLVGKRAQLELVERFLELAKVRKPSLEIQERKMSLLVMVQEENKKGSQIL